MHWVWYQQCGGGSSGSEWRAALWPVLGLTLPMIKPAEGGGVGTSKWAASTMAAVVAAVAIVVKEEKTMVGVRQYLTIEEEKEDNKSTYSKEGDNGDDTTKKKWSANWLLRRWTYCSRESKLRLWCCWGYFSIAVRRPGYLAPLCWWPWWSSTSVPMSLTWPDLLAGINDGSHHRQVCWAHIAGKLLWHTNASGEHWGTTAAGWPFILCQKGFQDTLPRTFFICAVGDHGVRGHGGSTRQMLNFTILMAQPDRPLGQIIRTVQGFGRRKRSRRAYMSRLGHREKLHDQPASAFPLSTRTEHRFGPQRPTILWLCGLKPLSD